jgi:hypothetical protein
MVDWYLVGFSALWILGLSLMLATLSYADYEAYRRQARTRDVLAEPGYQLALNAGLSLFCLGLLGSARAWWERALWVVLALAFSVQVVRAWQARRRHTPKAG